MLYSEYVTSDLVEIIVRKMNSNTCKSTTNVCAIISNDVCNITHPLLAHIIKYTLEHANMY